MICSKCGSDDICGKVATKFTATHMIPVKWEYRCEKCLDDMESM